MIDCINIIEIESLSYSLNGYLKTHKLNTLNDIEKYTLHCIITGKNNLQCLKLTPEIYTKSSFGTTYKTLRYQIVSAHDGQILDFKFLYLPHVDKILFRRIQHHIGQFILKGIPWIIEAIYA